MSDARPASLRAYLDEGGDLGRLDSKSLLPWLSDYVVSDRRRNGVEAMRREQREYNQNALNRARIRREFRDAAPTPEARRQHEQHLADEDTFYGWCDELLADETLFERVEAALPRDIVEKQLLDLDAETRPFAVVTEERESYVCAATGETCHGRAIVIRPRGWLEDLPNEWPELVFHPDVFVDPRPERGLRSA